jgi:hypothetical protein
MKLLSTLASLFMLASCANSGGFGDYGARVSNDRRQSHKLISSADEAQFDRQRRNERNEAYHQGDMQQEQINSYRRPIQGIRGGLNDVIGITNMFR